MLTLLPFSKNFGLESYFLYQVHVCFTSVYESDDTDDKLPDLEQDTNVTDAEILGN